MPTRISATMPAPAAMARLAVSHQPMPPAAAPVASEPSLRPRMPVSTAPIDRHGDEQEDRQVLQVEALARRRGFAPVAAGSGRPSPPMRASSRSIAAFRPPAKSFVAKGRRDGVGR